ncbi:hypothetical protein A1Q2_06401 [Trichosporon asahii var. asahii CBS 8904]|uniref:Uncharacterized protein n=1 Tax=Trichosporon asahii var. asahii (strain CBS 8904) TaxID=1220162 RepID=K1VJ81_TRIAC|nr:hypothetical protein A1Q2_06401 [Trichosporon asahii var. asahii CBS 8904]
MLAIILTLLTFAQSAPVGRPVPDVVARHDRKRPGVIIGAVVGSVVGAFIIAFAIFWWRGKGCLDRKRPVTPSPPESARASIHSQRSQQSRIIGRVTHEEGWRHLPNPTVPSSAPSIKSAREKDDPGASVTSLSSPRKNDNRPQYIKASSPPPAPAENPWKIPRPRSANSVRSGTSSPVKEPYIRVSSETSRERRVSLQERLEQRERTASDHKEDLTEPGARAASMNRDPPLNRKPSFTMMLKNSSRVSLGATGAPSVGGYVTTQERLRNQDECSC